MHHIDIMHQNRNAFYLDACVYCMLSLNFDYHVTHLLDDMLRHKEHALYIDSEGPVPVIS